MPGHIYLRSPHPDVFPGISGWIQEAIGMFSEEHPQWTVDHQPYDRQGNFGVHHLYVKALNNPGPIVLIKPVQTKAVYLLRQKAMNQTVLLDNVEATCTEDIWYALTEARRLADEGYPMLPRKLVVAVLIVRKLVRQKQWGGKKGYLKSTDLPEGGIPPVLKGHVLAVANDLRLHHVLVHKLGDGLMKYGLNNADVEGIHSAANGDFSHYPDLKKMLERDDQLVTGVWLKEDLHVDKFSVTPPVGQSQDFLKAHAAVSSLEAGADGEYKICVHFNTNRQLWDKFSNKVDAIAFVAGFA